MKFRDMLGIIDQNTRIRLIVSVWGMQFSTEHFAGYYDHDESYDFAERDVSDISVVDNVLEVVLK